MNFGLRIGDAEASVRIEGTPANALVTVDDLEPERISARWDNGVLEVRHPGSFRRYRHVASKGRSVWLARDGHCVAVEERADILAKQGEAAGGGPVKSPMPGTVLVVKIGKGDTVSAGTPLMVVEAMKMEHTITAPVDGVVTELHVQAGQQVALDEALAVVTPQEEQA